MKEHNKASSWFDDMYRENEKSQEKIPWAKKRVNPLLEEYLKSTKKHQGKALVIGCGLGDDAHALELAGYEVTAIDVSESALKQSKERFKESKIIFKKQDIFEYKEVFDFVFEAFTIQSLPIEFRVKMIEAVANRVEKNGRLLLVAHKREHMFDGPPWPLEEEEVELFKTYGLSELSHEIHHEESPLSNSHFCVLFEKTIS